MLRIRWFSWRQTGWRTQYVYILYVTVLSKFVGQSEHQSAGPNVRQKFSDWKKILGFVNEITINLQKWPRPGQLVGKTKTNVKQILRWNKLETKQNIQQTAQRGHSNTVGNPACRGWHLKMVKWHVLTMWRLSKNVDPDYSMPIIVMTHRSFSVILSSHIREPFTGPS